MTESSLTRPEVAHRLEGSEWRLILGALHRSVVVGSLDEAAQLSTAITTTLGESAWSHLHLDLRSDLLGISVRNHDGGGIDEFDLGLVVAIDALLGDRAEHVAPPTRKLELCIDAMDIPKVRRFWEAVFGISSETGFEGDDVVDPRGQLPALWFQQLDEPREGRNRIHFDLSVPHDRADAILQDALAAGGTLVSDANARSFWILADPEGNEVCICTWQDRN
jgi:4a-hydroxytetrahydrobiopterin dehydratase